MRFLILSLAGILTWSTVSGVLPAKKAAEQEKAAGAVLNRVLGSSSGKIVLTYRPESKKPDSYEYSASNGMLKVTGNSAIALTRGVYDYLKNNRLGMLDWSGPLFNIPARMPDAKPVSVTSPFAIRHAYNVVTAGYTTPYWTWQRWEQELDWQAMHGFNMMMAPVATEAIASRVWKKMGLTQKEIDEFYVGPAHLPWQRMGNICQVGGTLPPEWHKDQVALQHKILNRMRQLGIKPVVQSFAGFVPKALKRIYPNLVLHSTLWNAGFPESQRPVLIMPDDPVFAKITKLYMQEWQKEFGNADYFLVDSFNELELPKTDKPATELLADYGEKTYNAIKAAKPDATWVIQGWMFAYQRNIWNNETVRALFSKVPDSKVLILDYANDYENNWQPMNAFNGKQWVYGFVPNMGGKTAYTGDLSLYATGAAKALASPNKKNLVGFTISGEGLENNNVVYELLTDAAWSSKEIDLNSWLELYSVNRYGGYPEKMKESWQMLLKSCYKNLVPHPQLGWQMGRAMQGWVNRDPEFFKGVELFLDCSDELGASQGYRADAVERAAIALGLKADEWFTAAANAYNSGLDSQGDMSGKRGLELLSQADRLLASHPLDRLDKWLELAKAHSANPELQKFYETNARQIVTVWGPPVNDYSCRIWSGLIRDFYLERMKVVLNSVKEGKPFDRNEWELKWVNATGISPVTPYPDPVKAAKELVAKAMGEKLPEVAAAEKNRIGEWSAANVSQEWTTIEWTISSGLLKQLKGVVFNFKGGNHRLEIKEVEVVADGKVVAKDTHEGVASGNARNNRYVLTIPDGVSGNNGCSIRATVRTNGGTSSKGAVYAIF